MPITDSAVTVTCMQALGRTRTACVHDVACAQLLQNIFSKCACQYNLLEETAGGLVTSLLQAEERSVATLAQIVCFCSSTFGDASLANAVLQELLVTRGPGEYQANTATVVTNVGLVLTELTGKDGYAPALGCELDAWMVSQVVKIHERQGQ
jgi:hypothetical protein